MTRTSRLRPHALLTDKPGVMVHDPRRQLIQILVLYALLPLICSAAGSYIVYELANARINERVQALEADLAERRRVNTESNRARDARLEQTRRDLCVVVDRVQPRDKAVEELRLRYGCTATPPTIAPSPSPSPRTPLPSGGRTTGTGSSGGRTTTAGNEDAADPRPAPAPGPSGPSGPTGPAGPPPTTPSPPPADPDGDALVCLPVIGCVL